MKTLNSGILVCAILCIWGCENNNTSPPGTEIPLTPDCTKPPSGRIDTHSPAVMVSDWGPPVRLGSPLNTPCPEDAIEISRDGTTLYFLFTEDVLDSLTPTQMLDLPNGTYRAQRIGGPGEFDVPNYFDLGQGTGSSLDGEISYSPDGQEIYFHSVRPENLGYQQNPPIDDYLDIYVAEVVNGVPGPGVNLGAPVNSVYLDGEQTIHPDGISLYFTSNRPGGLGGNDLWVSVKSTGAWTDPINLGTPINSGGGDTQPAFTADGDTMYFVSDRNTQIGPAIYRSNRTNGFWNDPELVLTGLVGEPSLTADGKYLYFVHVLSDAAGGFDADVWYTSRPVQ